MPRNRTRDLRNASQRAERCATDNVPIAAGSDNEDCVDERAGEERDEQEVQTRDKKAGEKREWNTPYLF
jgi:hypothetical protein